MQAKVENCQTMACFLQCTNVNNFGLQVPNVNNCRMKFSSRGQNTTKRKILLDGGALHLMHCGSWSSINRAKLQTVKPIQQKQIFIGFLQVRVILESVRNSKSVVSDIHWGFFGYVL